MTSLFAYGTLEIPQVITAVTGRTFSASAASLPNHARFLLQDQTYPGTTREFGSHVNGVLYANVDADSLALLDVFEGDFYRRETVRALTPSRQSVDAVAYLVPADRRALLTSNPWDRETFVARHLDDYLPYCHEFHTNHSRRLGFRADPR